MAWNPQRIMLFYELKHDVTSYPVLTWFDPDKPTILKTYWSSERMSWIIMQAATDKESQHASTVLKYTGTCLFDFHPMVIGFNLLYLDPGPVLILNASIIPSSEKPPAAHGSPEKIAHISGASIFGGSMNVQL